jgi:hypothetical protein
MREFILKGAFSVVKSGHAACPGLWVKDSGSALPNKGRLCKGGGAIVWCAVAKRRRKAKREKR